MTGGGLSKGYPQADLLTFYASNYRKWEQSLKKAMSRATWSSLIITSMLSPMGAYGNDFWDALTVDRGLTACNIDPESIDRWWPPKDDPATKRLTAKIKFVTFEELAGFTVVSLQNDNSFDASVRFSLSRDKDGCDRPYAFFNCETTPPLTFLSSASRTYGIDAGKYGDMRCDRFPPSPDGSSPNACIVSVKPDSAKYNKRDLLDFAEEQGLCD